MELLVVSINAVVVAAVGGILAWLGKGRFEAIDRRFEALDHRIDRLETRLDGRIDSLDARVAARIDGLDRRFETLQASVDAMRSDLTQVALAVGVRPRAQNG
jgi:flagellar capping protein FliD